MEVEDFGARFAIAVEDVSRSWHLISEVTTRRYAFRLFDVLISLLNQNHKISVLRLYAFEVSMRKRVHPRTSFEMECVGSMASCLGSSHENLRWMSPINVFCRAQGFEGTHISNKLCSCVC